MPKLPRILAVDDHPRNLNILRKILGREFDLITAASGQEALDLAFSARPDLVLLDIMMPGLDGYETCRRLRAYPQLSPTKIIMVSAKAMLSERLEGYAAGADDYVVKPFDHEEMLAKVRVYLRLKSVEEINDLKSELLSLFNHETRTPLAGILGPVSLLLDSPDLTDQQRELIQMVESGAHRLLDLVEKVTLLSQLKAGTVALQLEPCDLTDIASKAVKMAAARAEKAEVSLVLEAEGPVEVMGHPEQLLWAIGVILDNAIRFSPAGDRVLVRTSDDVTGPVLSVSDHGPGIDPDLLPRIFDEFVVADLQHHSGGHGLSLATARLIVEQHGGTLTVKSESGSGASFHVNLIAASETRDAA